MNVIYPPVGHYRTLTREQKRERRDIASDLLPLVQWLRGDPRLSSWEEGFLASIASMLYLTHGTVSLSPKQWAVIRRLMTLLDEDPAEAEEDTEDPEDDTD